MTRQRMKNVLVALAMLAYLVVSFAFETPAPPHSTQMRR